MLVGWGALGQAAAPLAEGLWAWRRHVVVDAMQARQAAGALCVDAVVVAASVLQRDFIGELTALRQRIKGCLVVLAKDFDAVDEILAIELGADDYLALPGLAPRRLHARLAAVCRRDAAASGPAEPAARVSTAPAVAGVQAQAVLRCGAHELDLRAGVLRAAARPGVGPTVLPLSWPHLQVLSLLFESADQVVGRDAMWARLCWPPRDVPSRRIDTLVYRVRQLLAQATGGELVIDTAYGHGYRLRAIETPAAPAPGSSARDNAPAAVSFSAQRAAALPGTGRVASLFLQTATPR
jgi:DNA-binding response OmpR family regulator